MTAAARFEAHGASWDAAMFCVALLVALAAPQEPLTADPAELRRTVTDLVGFGTRHVLSASDDPDRGTGAARAYLERRYRERAERSNGRLQVERQVFDVACRRRGMPTTVQVVNIVATLPGTTDPAGTCVCSATRRSVRTATAAAWRAPRPGPPAASKGSMSRWSIEATATAAAATTVRSSTTAFRPSASANRAKTTRASTAT